MWYLHFNLLFVFLTTYTFFTSFLKKIMYSLLHTFSLIPKSTHNVWNAWQDRKKGLIKTLGKLWVTVHCTQSGLCMSVESPCLLLMMVAQQSNRAIRFRLVINIQIQYHPIRLCCWLSTAWCSGFP